MKNLYIILTFTFLSCFSLADHITPEEQALFTLQAEDFFDDTLQKLSEIINSQSSQIEKANKLNELLKQVVNLNLVSRYIMGRAYRTMTKEQKKEYKDLASNYIIYKLSKNLLTFVQENQKMPNIQKTRTLFVHRKKGWEVFISTFIKSKTNNSHLEFLLTYHRNSLKIADVQYEGVSFIVSLRSKMQAMLENSGNNIPSFLGLLKQINKTN